MKISTSIRGKLAIGYVILIAAICAIDWTNWAADSQLNRLAADFSDSDAAIVSETRQTIANLAQQGVADPTAFDANVRQEMDGLLGDLDAAINQPSAAKAREAFARVRAQVDETRARLLDLEPAPVKPDDAAVDRALARMAQLFDSNAAAYQSQASRQIEDYHGRCLVLIAIALALAALFHFRLSRSILAPLNRVAAVATDMVQGDFSSTIVTDGDDELSLVLRALSEMQKKVLSDRTSQTETNARLHFALIELETRERELQIYKYSLEKLVAERTAELAENNEQLKNEIAQRQKIEKDLVAAKELADAANRAKSQFLANMSHEIRTPMNGVIGMVDLLRQTGLAPRQEHFATVIRQSARALLTIINDLLDFSKIEAGELSLDISTVDLRACADDVANLLAEAAQKKGIELTYVIADAVPHLVRGDLARIRQILVNLVGNAIKFTERGDVALQIEAFSMGLGGNLTRIRFDVRDTGIGIPKEAIKGIFDAFRQVDGGSNRRFEGTGLGLSIVQQLVKIMGGRIEVESEVGQGSLFRVELTLAVAKSVERTMPAVSTSFEGKRALVVDDSEASRKLIAHYLAKLRIACEGVASGDAALHALSLADRSGRPYDFAVVDAVMPAMNGIDLVRRIRANATTAGLPVVMLSSYGSAAVSATAPDIGNAASLAKPLREADFRECIADLFTPSPPSLMSFMSIDPGVATDAPTVRWPALNLRILLAEDSPINQEIAREHLSSFGCVVDAVSNGAEALAAVDAGTYDAIVMDCQMPGIDGFEAARRIRERQIPNGPSRRVPIIALTAFASSADRARCIAAGMDDCLTKPFEPGDLYRMVEHWTVGQADDASPRGRQPATPEPVKAPVGLDPKAIEALRRAPCLNGSGLLEKVGRLFLETVPKDLADLVSAIEAGAADRVALIAHKLRSAASHIGASKLAEVFRDLEENAAAGRLDDAPFTLRDIQLEFEHTVAALRREMAEAA